MPQISKAETSYYLSALTLFWSKLRIAKELGVTHLTVTRWVAGETLPSDRYRDQLNQAIEKLFDELEEQSYMGAEIVDLIETHKPPERNAVIMKKGSRTPLRSLILSMLQGKTRVKSTKIFDEAAKYKYTKISVHQMAKRLGVVKSQVGQGRDSYSYWSLP